MSSIVYAPTISYDQCNNVHYGCYKHSFRRGYIILAFNTEIPWRPGHYRTLHGCLSDVELFFWLNVFFLWAKWRTKLFSGYATYGTSNDSVSRRIFVDHRYPNMDNSYRSDMVLFAISSKRPYRHDMDSVMIA